MSEPLTRAQVEKMFRVGNGFTLSVWPFELQPQTVQQLLVTDAALRQQLAEAQARVQVLEGELRNIAEADTCTWDDPEDFKAWAQNRARHTLTTPQRSSHD